MRRTFAIALLCALGAPQVLANSDPLTGVISVPGGAGLGVATRFEHSPYRGGGTRNDLVPIYLYEGKYVYLHAYRLGLKLEPGERHRFDLFLSHRFEGFPYDRVPPSLAGMAKRGPGLDLGASYELRGDWGAAYAEFLHDATDAAGGSELRLGYKHEWRDGRLRLRPHAMLAVRDARLNDYYYGVLPTEATAQRPAYAPGSGANLALGLYAAYSLTERWRLLAGVSATRWAKAVRVSPIVENRTQLAGVLGLMYDFSPEARPWPDRAPLALRVLYGASSDCDVLQIVRLSCTSTHTQDGTSVAGFEIGRPFVERLNGWPLDIYGVLGLLRHKERGLQSDFWQTNAYVKAYYHGFPWSERVRTRIGLGVGVAYAHAVPFVELRDQAARGRGNSKLLNYLDPSVDLSVGDLLGVRALRETYLGIGVSHRSGIFGASQLLGNVNGGSNYIYSYLEWKM
ncbi:MAG: MipA/OmpV family protein [Burkholderiales bacterium]